MSTSANMLPKIRRDLFTLATILFIAAAFLVAFGVRELTHYEQYFLFEAPAAEKHARLAQLFGYTVCFLLPFLGLFLASVGFAIMDGCRRLERFSDSFIS